MQTQSKNNNQEKVYRSKKNRGQEKWRPIIQEMLGVLLRALLGGMMLSFACLCYLSIDSKYLGTTLFAFGFLVVYHYRFQLFNAEVGYALSRNKRQNFQLIVLWFGNVLGTLIIPFLLGYTRIYDKISTRAESVCKDRLADTAFSVFLLAVLCGILMFVSVDGFRHAENGWTKLVLFAVPVMAFIFCGLEHRMLDLFYIVMAQSFSFRAAWYLLVITFGNALGSLLIPGFYWVYRHLVAPKG